MWMSTRDTFEGVNEIGVVTIMLPRPSLVPASSFR